MLGSSFSHTCILSASMFCVPPLPRYAAPASTRSRLLSSDNMMTVCSGLKGSVCAHSLLTTQETGRCSSAQASRGFSVPCRVRPESSQWPARLSPSWAPYCTPSYLLPQGLCMAILSPIYDPHGSLPLPILAQPSLSQADVPFDSGPLVLAFLAPSSCYGFLHSICHHVP